MESSETARYILSNCKGFFSNRDYPKYKNNTGWYEIMSHNDIIYVVFLVPTKLTTSSNPKKTDTLYAIVNGVPFICGAYQVVPTVLSKNTDGAGWLKEIL